MSETSTSMVESSAVPKRIDSEKLPKPSLRHISFDSLRFVINISISPSLSISFKVIFLVLELGSPNSLDLIKLPLPSLIKI